MAFRKNKKFIDPRYFMDEKTEIIKEELSEMLLEAGPWGREGSAVWSQKTNHQNVVETLAYFSLAPTLANEWLDYAKTNNLTIGELYQDLKRRVRKGEIPDAVEPSYQHHRGSTSGFPSNRRLRERK